jgi:hypothetical protein
VSEELSVKDLTNNFLESPRVDASTVVVTDVLGTLLLEGVDYELIQIGDRTSIEVLPDGDIELGQTLFVEYDYEDAPQLKFSTTRLAYGLGWDIGWLALGYQHRESSEDLLEGEEEGFLRDSRVDSYRATIRRRAGSVRGSAWALFTRERGQTLDRDEWRLTQNLLWDITPRLALRIDLTESDAEFQMPERSTRSLTGNVSLAWRPARRHKIRLYARIWSFEDSLSEDQFRITFGGRAQIAFRTFKAIPSLEWSRRDRDPSRVTDLRLVFRLVWSPWAG